MATRKIKICIDGRKYLVTGSSREVFKKDFLCSLAGKENQTTSCKSSNYLNKAEVNLDKEEHVKKSAVVLHEKEITNTRNQEEYLKQPETSLVEAGIEFGIFYINNVQCEKQEFKRKGIIPKKGKSLALGRKPKACDYRRKKPKTSGKKKIGSREAKKTEKVERRAVKEKGPLEVEIYDKSNTEIKQEDCLLKEEMFASDKMKMHFACSKEEWVDEIRKKSRLYALKDENQNYIDLSKGERSDSEADIDSGIPSIDGDTPQEKILTRNSIEQELFLARQDSGVSSESAENSTSTAQTCFEVLATDNKRLPCRDFGKQVILNWHADVTKGGRETRAKSLSKNNYEEIRKLVHHSGKEILTPKEEVSSSNKKRNSFGKECNLREESSQDLMKICPSAGGSDSNCSILDKHLMSENNKIGHCVQNSQLRSSKRAEKKETELESLKLHGGYDCNCLTEEARRSIERNEVRRDSKDSGYSDKSIARNKKEEITAKNKEDIERTMIWKEYKELTKNISDTLDQLLFKDLMIANLTTDILNFSNENYSIEDDMIELEEKYLQNEIFDTHSLLQTVELITEKECVEKHFLEKHIERTEREIEDKRFMLQTLERLYRINKFKTMPKPLKRYCSTESLMSDVDKSEKHEHLETLLDVEEPYQEETSLV